MNPYVPDPSNPSYTTPSYTDPHTSYMSQPEQSQSMSQHGHWTGPPIAEMESPRFESGGSPQMGNSVIVSPGGGGHLSLGYSGQVSPQHLSS